MNDFLEIIIVGAVLSFVLEWIQKTFKTKGGLMKFYTILFALIVGSIYYFLKETIYWQTILGVLGSASTVYAFLFANKKTE